MTVGKRAAGSNQPGAGRPRKAAGKKRPRGTDLALTLPTSNGSTLALTYWDLWFVRVAVTDHGGNLERMATAYCERQYFLTLHDHMTWDFYLSRERGRNHLLDLKRRLQEAAVTPTQIVNAASDFAETEKWLLNRRVSWPSEWKLDLSLPMQNSPRKRRSEHALRGFWPRFPVSPGRYAAEICSKIKIKRFFSEGKSSVVAQTLGRYVDQSGTLLKSGKSVESQALLRALMTIAVELLQINPRWNRDIQIILGRSFAAYLEIPLGMTVTDEKVFFADILNFLTWNDRWLADNRMEHYFKGLNESQADLCINHLRDEVAGLHEDLLEDRLEEALNLLGQLIVAQERFDEFEDVARLVAFADDSWRIMRLVELAMKRRKRSLACKVFEAALNGEGWASCYLKEQYEKLKRDDWSPAPNKES